MWRSKLGLGVSRGRRAASTPILDPDDHAHGVKRGLQISKSRFVLALELLDVPIELPLRSADLLLKQIGTVLQVATDVAHLMIPPAFNRTFSNDQTGA
jgi:hypothetical protein